MYDHVLTGTASSVPASTGPENMILPLFFPFLTIARYNNPQPPHNELVTMAFPKALGKVG